MIASECRQLSLDLVDAGQETYKTVRRPSSHATDSCEGEIWTSGLSLGSCTAAVAAAEKNRLKDQQLSLFPDSTCRLTIGTAWTYWLLARLRSMGEYLPSLEGPLRLVRTYQEGVCRQNIVVYKDDTYGTLPPFDSAALAGYQDGLSDCRPKAEKWANGKYLRV